MIKRAGFAFLEFLISIGIIIVIVGVLMSTYSGVMRGMTYLTGKAMVTSDMRVILEQFGRDVQQSQDAPAECAGGSFPVSSTRVVLSIPATANCVVYQCNAGSCTEENPGRLERIIAPDGIPNPGQTRIFSEGMITDLSFGRADLNSDGVMDQVTLHLGIAASRVGNAVRGRIKVKYNLRL